MKSVVFVLMLAVLLMPIVGASAARPEKFKDVLVGFEAGRFDPGVVDRAGGHVKKDLKPLVHAVAAKIPERLVEALRHNPAVKYVEEDAVAFAVGHAAPPSLEYANSWGVDHIEADVVHSAGGSMGSGINIAVMDTGVNYNHPELAPSYKGGHDFINGDSDPMDDNGHGTHVAGILAAARDGRGVVGVAPSVNLYALKVLGSDGRGSYSEIIAALNWAASNNMHIASVSLGGTFPSTALATAVKNAYESGVLLVAAAGNAGSSSILYPAAYEQVIAVGATDGSDGKASWSNYGSKIETVAPGVSIRSTAGDSGYATYSGTSMATPHVSGVAALAWAGGGMAADNAGVRAVLQDAALDLGVSGRDSIYGYGLVRADRAAAAATDATDPQVEITSPAEGAALAAGTLHVEGAAADIGSGVKAVEVRVDDGLYADAVPSAPDDWSAWSIDLAFPETGAYRILARATDNANNQDWFDVHVNVVEEGFTPDETRPDVTVTSPGEGDFFAPGTVRVEGTAADNGGGSGVEIVEVRVDDGSYATTTPVAAGDYSAWSIDLEFSETGTYRILARATDAAGNQDWYSVNIDIVAEPSEQDTERPTVEITSLAGGETLPAGTVTITGTAADNDGGSGIKDVLVKDYPGPYRMAAPAGPDDWSTWSISLEIAEPGEHRILARATDNAGNQYWNSVIITIQ